MGKSNGIDVKLAQLSGKIDTHGEKIDTLIQSFGEFKNDTRERVSKTEEKIEVFAERFELLGTLGKWIFAPVISAIVLAVLGLVLIKK